MISIPNFVAIDTETTGLYVYKGHRPFAAAAWFPDSTLKYWRDEENNLRYCTELEAILADTSVDKVFMNAKFDLLMLESVGLSVKGRVWDIAIFAHLLDGRDAHKKLNLDAIVKKYLPGRSKLVDEIDDWFRKEGIDPKKKRDQSKVKYHKLPHDLLRRRAETDTELTGELFQKFFITVAKTFPFLLDQEHRLLHVVKRAEERGMLVDLEEIYNQEDELTEIIDDVTDWLAASVDKGSRYFNINASSEVYALLENADLLKCITEKTEKTEQPSLSDSSLRSIYHPVTHMLLVGRQASKLRDTFLSQLLNLNYDGVLRPQANQIGTIGGRFSYSQPNTTNIPMEGDSKTGLTKEEVDAAYELTGYSLGQHIKKCFNMRPGFAHIYSDQSQAEMRVLAHYAKDQTMIDIFATGESIHDGFCRHIYGEVTPGLKRKTKGVVFGYIYGAGLKKLATTINCSIYEAGQLKRKLQQKFPSLTTLQGNLYEYLEDYGYVTSIHGRRHYLYKDQGYMAVNRLCQSTVADEIKSRMVDLGECIEANGLSDVATVLMNIHDEVVIEVAEKAVPDLVPEFYRIMNETEQDYLVPLKANCCISYTNWADKVDIDEPLKPETYTRKALQCQKQEPQVQTT